MLCTATQSQKDETTTRVEFTTHYPGTDNAQTH